MIRGAIEGAHSVEASSETFGYILGQGIALDFLFESAEEDEVGRIQRLGHFEIW